LISFGEACKLWSSSLFSLLQPPAPSSHLGPNILITLFSVLYSSISVRDQVSHPYRTSRMIHFLFSLRS
jgi:hypothetical protein